ncbi:sphingosine kinase 2 [Teleopsis dalmanni]|uniref:sphingosine kinase 2 n=1 Tax=Teleopsis dalmanni TaxID=139649 RepID=UPI0018CDF0ED|nr:sphingosine kinase 2 [Teleopsis dalmanni]XP_037936036.1 sphingosine kinase 2 [Teleopsis dalmanni]
MIEQKDNDLVAIETVPKDDTDGAMQLSDIFYTSKKKDHVFKVKLNSRGFILQRETVNGSKEQLINISDIVGGRCGLQKSKRSSKCSCSSLSSTQPITSSTEVNLSAEGDVSAFLYVFAYILKKNIRSTLRRARTVLTLRFRSFDTFEENIREADRWYKALKFHKKQSIQNTVLLSENGRLLFLLNPKSGSGKAREHFNRYVVPILNEAEIPYDLYITKNSKYAVDFVRMRNISQWCGIVAVGGDGLLHEIINGLLQRSDWNSLFQHISIGVIPCGSGNGLARSIANRYKEPYEPKPILSAALTVISGKTSPMDIVQIELKNKIMYSFLSVGWGLISDIDIESERLRSLGYQRFTIWTLHRLVRLRTYRGKVAYQMKYNKNDELCSMEEQKAKQNNTSFNAFLNNTDSKNFQPFECNGDNEFDDVISLETTGNQSFRSRCGSWLSAGSRKSTYYSISESIYRSVASDSDYEQNKMNPISGSEQYYGPTISGPHLNDPIPDNWEVEEGEFIMVHAVYQSHLSSDCYFSPYSKLNDGTIYLVIIRNGISRSQLLNFLMNMSSGTHLPVKNNEFIHVVAVTAFRLEPSGGIITVDGELVELGSLQGQIIPGLSKIMVPK